MSKLVMLKGLPGSGKSTRAKEIMDKGGNFVRLNRDLLRTMLHFNKWSGKNEGVTKKVQRAIAKELLIDGINVIIDDTNLGESHEQSWRSLAYEIETKELITVKFVVEDLTKNLDIKELFKRDSERENSVGRHVIISMAMQYKLVGPDYFGSKGKWVICDIDGTLADISHRLHFVKDTGIVCKECKGDVIRSNDTPWFCKKCNVYPEIVSGPKDWKSFFESMIDDKVREDIRDKVLEYKNAGYSIVFVSGRPDNYRDETKYWLSHIAFKGTKFVEGEDYATILMRRAGDKRPDNEVKQNILDTYFNKNDIEVVIDDRPRVIEMWKEQGLQVIDVGQGVDF